MKILNLIGSSVFQVISLISVLAYLLGVLNIYFSDKTNYCVMTYMFEYPQFVRLSLPENNIYPQYGLYAYSEGRFTERARKMWFDGVPVLYLPGNSGSHMQARSLASVALRKALSRGYEFHFDFFTISFNEELSGLYGGVLEGQTEFAAACVSRILSLYKNNKFTKNVPTHVVLIGHSMGGLIAKRLLAYPSTINITDIAIALAAPLEAPVINIDLKMNDYYMHMQYEWNEFVNSHPDVKHRKMLIGFGNGPRDVLVPSGLTSSSDSNINALTTAVPGVWVSPDHVCIVWCKQLVMAINRYLFSIIDQTTEQIVNDKSILMARAKTYFQANRSMNLSDDEVNRTEATMIVDAFWYEDNRRIYQISRPEIEKTTYLMIRLIKFPQNRFVAVEAVNVEDKDWIFGCNAMYTYQSYRYCKTATSLSELSRWTGAATDFGKRKLATVNLHSNKEKFPDWTHVIVKVSPTRKPIILNVDINDHASRRIDIHVPSDLSFDKRVVVPETEEGSLYYELILRDFNAVHQAYLLYVEPKSSCKATQYHVSAELHLPWAENHETYHYFTQAKLSPMKLRLFKSNPNISFGIEPTEFAKVTLLLDPQCTYTISISTSFYHRLAQLVRNYTPTLVPYVAVILLLAARANINSLREKGICISIHSALMSESVKPYYSVVFGRIVLVSLVTFPYISRMFDYASDNNVELQYFVRSMIVLPVYMTAIGILNIAAAAILVAMVFSSQVTHTLFVRMVWRGGRGLAGHVAGGLQKVPMVVSAALICAAQVACGAAALAAGAAFYAFLLSKMYEDYLEDYLYKLMAQAASRICRMFKRQNTDEPEQALAQRRPVLRRNKSKRNRSKDDNDSDNKEAKDTRRIKRKNSDESSHSDVDEDLNNLNFHMMMFFLWLAVTLVNVPALLTWARNFKYSMALKPDTSYHTGLIMSVCSTCLWQMEGPRKNLKFYEGVSSLLFTMAVFIMALGPLSLTIVNYGITFMFAVLTIQQVFDKEENLENIFYSDDDSGDDRKTKRNRSKKRNQNRSNETSDSDDLADEVHVEQCDSCNENRIYSIFRRLREKLSFEDNAS